MSGSVAAMLVTPLIMSAGDAGEGVDRGGGVVSRRAGKGVDGCDGTDGPWEHVAVRSDVEALEVGGFGEW